MMQRKLTTYQNYKFYASERLKLKKHIETLFSQGKVFSVKPIIIKYLWVNKDKENEPPTKSGFAVSKKKFKKAVQRNSIKRLMREVWRLHKPEFAEQPSDKQLHVFFIFNSQEFPDFTTVHKAMEKGIMLLKKEMPEQD